jgi:hypothetical protein
VELALEQAVVSHPLHDHPAPAGTDGEEAAFVGERAVNGVAADVGGHVGG